MNNLQTELEAPMLKDASGYRISLVISSAVNQQEHSYEEQKQGFNNFFEGEVFKIINSEYKISSTGKLYRNGKERKPYFSCKGTYIVTIGAKRFALASLVAKYFVPNPDNFRNIGFYDRDNNNCKADNLYWMDNKEYYKYCGLHKCENKNAGRKKIQGDRLTAITQCECYLLREYYITLNEEWIKESFEIAWKQLFFKNRQKVKSICYEYFYDRAKRFSLTYRPVSMLIHYRRTALNIWRKENLYPKRNLQYNDNILRA